MNMNNILLKLIVFICLCASLTSCFDIVDEININEDGSGEIMLTANLSKSKTKIASVMLLDSINGYKVFSKADIEKALSDAEAFLKNAEGISGVTRKADFENYIFSISCKFKSVENIDNIVQEITKTLKFKPVTISYSYNQSAKILSKQYTYSPDAKKKYDRLKAEDKKIFDDATYTSIFRFENEVASTSNSLSNVSKSKKAVMLKAAALDLIDGKISLANTIQLK